MVHCPWKARLEALGLLTLRVLIGYGIALHGWGKINGDMQGFADGVVTAKLGLPFPIVFAWAAALSEGVGGVLLALGLFTRLASFLILFTMGTAFFVFHATDPWDHKEMAFLYGGTALSLLLTGAGCYSIDALIFCRKKDKEACCS
ncbi:MAG: DoxX family protein [Deltaproteobacteria bacterium]|nr:DoxX family protein [Deltaproteobacteria bacterium]MBI4197188.1 DoxX family protein [Deltaproteobacteria bacterium]